MSFPVKGESSIFRWVKASLYNSKLKFYFHNTYFSSYLTELAWTYWRELSETNFLQPKHWKRNGFTFRRSGSIVIHFLHKSILLLCSFVVSDVIWFGPVTTNYKTRKIIQSLYQSGIILRGILSLANSPPKKMRHARLRYRWNCLDTNPVCKILFLILSFSVLQRSLLKPLWTTSYSRWLCQKGPEKHRSRANCAVDWTPSLATPTGQAEHYGPNFFSS